MLFALRPGAFAQNGGSTAIAAEDMERLHAVEDSMVVMVDSMYAGFIPDLRTGYCEKFVRQLVRALKIPNSYTYPFDKLKTKINIIGPDDNSFRIFDWVIMPSEAVHRYYGAIQMQGEQLKLYPLVDYTAELGRNAPDSELTNSKWFGALYYRIMPREVNGQKIYTLFGLNESNPETKRKVLDPLIITENGPVFGSKIFRGGNNISNQYRFILEYKKTVQASMNWDDERQLIFFDHLVSQTNDPNRKYTYVPSGQYDGFKWRNNEWEYVEDLIPVQNLRDGEAPSGDQPAK